MYIVILLQRIRYRIQTQAIKLSSIYLYKVFKRFSYLIHISYIYVHVRSYLIHTVAFLGCNAHKTQGLVFQIKKIFNIKVFSHEEEKKHFIEVHIYFLRGQKWTFEKKNTSNFLDFKLSTKLCIFCIYCSVVTYK